MTEANTKAGGTPLAAKARAWGERLQTKLGFNKRIFGADYRTKDAIPNPGGYPRDEHGYPRVPESDVVTGGIHGGKTVFGGAAIVSAGDGFVVRTELGAPNLQVGDYFAFRNQAPDRPPLVFEVTDIDRSGGSGSISLDTRDVGLLDIDIDE